jgi:hypothetical protein
MDITIRIFISGFTDVGKNPEILMQIRRRLKKLMRNGYGVVSRRGASVAGLLLGSPTLSLSVMMTVKKYLLLE